MKNVFIVSLLLSAPLAAAVPNAKQGDWPSWRGPAANGSVATGDFPTRWTPEEAAWKVALTGKGVSTPIVWKERVYLTTPADGQDAVLAVDKAGKQLWLTKLGPESGPRHRTLASSCNASPVTDGKGLFVKYRSGRLAALELDGTVRWEFNLDEKFGPEKLYWDSGSSPVVTDEALIVSRIHMGDSWVAAFDKKTGKQLWIQQRNYPAPAENDNGYATPVFFDYKGRLAFLLWGADMLTAHSAADGTLLWSCGGFNPKGTVNWPAIANPVISGDVVVLPVGRDDRNQAHLFGVRLNGTGDVTETHRAWQRDDTGVFCSTPVEYKGKVYLLKPRGGLVCIEPATGKTLWQEALPRGAGSYYSSPIVANGILYAAREDGTVFAVRIDNGYELLSENVMGERIIASPVPMKNGLLLRSDRTLFYIPGKK